MRVQYLGRLALMASLALFGHVAAAADGEDPLYVRGRAVFNGTCLACHGIDPAWLRSTPGPWLYGVVGRKAGTLAGYNYSTAMMKSGIVWTTGNIEKYIANPLAMVPDNRMSFIGLPNPDDRKAVVAYIVKSGAQGAPPPEATSGLTLKRVE